MKTLLYLHAAEEAFKDFGRTYMSYQKYAGYGIAAVGTLGSVAATLLHQFGGVEFSSAICDHVIHASQTATLTGLGLLVKNCLFHSLTRAKKPLEEDVLELLTQDD